MKELSKCILTDYGFGNQVKFLPSENRVIGYQFPPVGEVLVSEFAIIQFENNQVDNKWILAGLCRHAFESKTEPPIIDTEFLKRFINDTDYPRTFREKVQILLKFIYDNGGKDYKPKKFHSAMDYPLAFAESEEEFTRVMDYCEDHSFIKWRICTPMSLGRKQYIDVVLTDLGIEEVLKDQPNIPMIGLVDQEIQTGNPSIDIKIQKAKKLFFEESSGMEEKRNACEQLSFVLEPLREELKDFFSSSDVSDFFQVVNRFDIRHNKPNTIKLKFEEQLEWIFYSLLNTINTYTKLSKRTELNDS